MEPKTRVEHFLNDIAQSGGGSGGGVFVVNVTTEDEGETYTADKTYAEISDAFENGMTVVAHKNVGNSENPVWSVLQLDSIGEDVVDFKTIAFVAGSGISHGQVTISDYNTVDVVERSYPGGGGFS